MYNFTCVKEINKVNLKALPRLFRFHQYVKNILVFLPALGAGLILEYDTFIKLVKLFIGFSLLASAVYILNDFLDREKDKNHPKKKFRPIASGEISINQSIILFFILLVFAITIVQNDNNLILIFGIYLGNNLLYSWILKRFAYLELASVSLNYVLRVIAGAVAIGVVNSNWLLNSIIGLAWGIVAAKRLGEKIILDNLEKNINYSTRQVLRQYTSQNLRYQIIFSWILSLISYFIWLLTKYPNLNSYYFISINLVSMTIFGKLFKVALDGQLDEPEALVTDKFLLITCSIWVCLNYITITAHID